MFFEVCTHGLQFFVNDFRRTQFARTRVHDLGAHSSKSESKRLTRASTREVRRSNGDGHLGEVTESTPAGVAVEQALGRVSHVAITARNHRSAVAFNFLQGAQSFLIVRVTHHDDVSVFTRHAEAVRQGFVLRNGRVVCRVSFGNHGATQTVHGVFMRATGTSGRLEEERVEHFAFQEVRASAHERFKHFSSLIEAQNFVTGEIVQERDVTTTHMGRIQDFTNITCFEVQIKCHGWLLIYRKSSCNRLKIEGMRWSLSWRLATGLFPRQKRLTCISSIVESPY